MSRDAGRPEVARPRSGLARAWVQSPEQLVCVVAAHEAGLLGHRTEILHPFSGAWADALLPCPPRGLHVRGGAAHAHLADGDTPDRWVAAPGTWHAIRPVLDSGSAEGVVIDDGTSLQQLVPALSRGTGIPDGMTGLLRAGRLVLTSGLSVEPVVLREFAGRGGRWEEQRFECWPGRPDPRPWIQRLVVVGDLLQRRPIGDTMALLTVLASDSGVVYLAATEDSSTMLAAVDAIPGVHVERDTAPVVALLDRLRRGHQLLAERSSALAPFLGFLGLRGVHLMDPREYRHGLLT
ncbi:hypothetical protein ACQ3I4_07860 [Zafaria sp. Z1313]|uniref:hypothetical protein n=1 Tax=Zafaria sp. Z1313 TaxID=3423202 RepID=UPI003D3033C8